MKLESLALHAGYSSEPTTKAAAVPIYQTTSFTFDDTQHGADLFDLKVIGNIYTRIMNPTQDVLEQRVAALEGGAAALALSSGTSAVYYAIINICAAGDEIVSANNLYGGTYTMFDCILPQFGIHTKFVDPREPANFDSAVTEKTKAIFIETIGNPLLEIENAAKEFNASMIITGTSTTGSLKERLLGSTPRSLAEKSVFPALLFPPKN